MGRELLETNATFRNSIEICAKALQPYGVDLLAAYESEDGFGEARTAAVGLASIQVMPCLQTILPAMWTFFCVSSSVHFAVYAAPPLLAWPPSRCSLFNGSPHSPAPDAPMHWHHRHAACTFDEACCKCW